MIIHNGRQFITLCALCQQVGIFRAEGKGVAAKQGLKEAGAQS